MEPVKQIWDWRDFGGGEGDGFYYGPAGSYRAGEGIDTRVVENGVKLVNNANDTGITYSGDLLSINKHADRCFSTRLSNDCKIYYQGTYKFTMSSGTTAYDMIGGWGQMTKLSDNNVYSYGFSSTSFGTGQIHRFNTNFGGATYNIGGGRTLGFNNPNNPTRGFLPTLSLPGRIVFGYANSIFQIDHNEVITKLVDLPKNAELISITYYQDTFKVFYNIQRYSSGIEDGYIGYWDGISSGFSQYVKYENSPINSVVNDGPIDYVVFGNSFTSDLYIVQGLQRQQIRVNVEESTNNTRKLGTASTIREGILYITGNSKLSAYNSTIYSFGNYYTGTNKSLVPGYKHITSNVIKGLNQREQSLDIFVDDDGGTDIGKIYNQSYFNNSGNVVANQNGWIFSYPCVGNNGMYTLKTISRIYVSYNLYNASDIIRVYAKKNGGPYSSNTSGWILLKTITGDTYLNKRGVIIDRGELLSLGLGDFHQLEYKVELVAGYNTSPILHQIRTIYLDNIKE